MNINISLLASSCVGELQHAFPYLTRAYYQCLLLLFYFATNLQYRSSVELDFAKKIS